MNKILIVDDEVEICFLLASILKKQGFDTSYAHSLKEGAGKIEADRYTTVFLDLNLPDGVGFNIIPQIKQANGDTKVIIISAYDGLTERRNAQEMGADYFISKPFNKQKIAEALQELNVV
jgi:DNA-binding response OmpR family regulator